MSGKTNNAVEELLMGRPVIFPTDTVNGIGCIYDDINCIEKIFSMKRRDAGKPLILLFDSMAMVDEYFALSSTEREIAETYMPGALTIIARMKNAGHKYISRNSTTGFRIPDNHAARELIRETGKPIAATSINFSGSGVLRDRSDISRHFKDTLIYAEPTEGNVPSTIISVEDRHIHILRKGKISIEERKWKQ